MALKKKEKKSGDQSSERKRVGNSDARLNVHARCRQESPKCEWTTTALDKKPHQTNTRGPGFDPDPAAAQCYDKYGWHSPCRTLVVALIDKALFDSPWSTTDHAWQTLAFEVRFRRLIWRRLVVDPLFLLLWEGLELWRHVTQKQQRLAWTLEERHLFSCLFAEHCFELAEHQLADSQLVYRPVKLPRVPLPLCVCATRPTGERPFGYRPLVPSSEGHDSSYSMPTPLV